MFLVLAAKYFSHFTMCIFRESSSHKLFTLKKTHENHTNVSFTKFLNVFTLYNNNYMVEYLVGSSSYKYISSFIHSQRVDRVPLTSERCGCSVGGCNTHVHTHTRVV